ncbi:MAG TPA: 2Fe-2S iron-sulfur cluster-binding protein [Pseudolabrys sp.]|nr:2Fe-2S iron-sulfur cluster-binding protein [Pseudolabrys sp.]
MTTVSLTVNGNAVSKTVSPRTHLADFVREELHLTGTHIGCEHGVCGACTMMVDGRPVRSCISFAAACDGSDVRTVESFDDDPVMIALRAAFSRRHALQCGYCTPGMLATAYDIITRLPDADEVRVREELAGNLCRCTGYVGIVAAIRDVLASGPHVSGLKQVRPAAPAPIASRTEPEHQPITLSSVSPSRPTSSAMAGGVMLSRAIDVPVSRDVLWQTLQRIDVMARCLPGASVEAIKDNGEVLGAFDVAIGPMRARFAGTAQVRFDRAAHRGEVSGGGNDGASRSQAEGTIRFAAAPVTSDASRLTLDLTYRLGGPLAQFGRPAVVAGVVDALLAQFARNLAQTSAGGEIAAQKPIRGFDLVLASLLAMLRRLFAPKPR